VIGETTIRVRYAETDTMGVVYYGNYLTYFEVGRVEFLRQNGVPMSEVDDKVRMPVVEATVRYVKPARLDDLLRVRCWIGERRRASFVFGYEIRRAETGDLVATGETRHACWHPETQKMIAIPPWLGALLVVTASPDAEGGPASPPAEADAVERAGERGPS